MRVETRALRADELDEIKASHRCPDCRSKVTAVPTSDGMVEIKRVHDRSCPTAPRPYPGADCRPNEIRVIGWPQRVEIHPTEEN